MSMHTEPAPPTVAELAKAMDLSAAFTGLGFALMELGKAATEAQQKIATYDAHFTFRMTRRDHRRMGVALARMLRRPALIHNGRKPR